MAVKIHPTAIVSDKADLAENVSVGPYSLIGDDVRIGDDSVIDSGVNIMGPSIIGKNVHIYHGASIGTDSQDKKFRPEQGRGILKIGDNTTIREFVTVNRGSTEPHKETSIGSGCWIMAYSHIAHDCSVGDNVVMSNLTTLAGHVKIGNNVNCGGFAAITQFCEIGDYTMVAAKTLVKTNIPPFVVTIGTETSRPKSVNLIALKRAGYDSKQIHDIHQCFNIMYKKEGKTMHESYLEMKEKYADISHVKPFIEFFTREIENK